MTVAANPIEGSSALKAGLKKGDVVYSINGEPTEKMTAMMLLDSMSNDERPSVTIEYSQVDDTAENPTRKTITLQRSNEKASNPVSYFAQKLTDGKLAG
jgi:C-terminal processing protease CtpA/Prc